MNVTREAIEQELTKSFVDLFDIKPEAVVPSALLREDLGLDSIDAIDLIVSLQNYTGKKIKPEQFKAIRTVEDTVTAVQALLEES